MAEIVRLRIYDISDPTAPITLPVVNRPLYEQRMTHLAAAQGALFARTISGSLLLFDTSAPSSVHILSDNLLDEPIQALCIAGDRLCVVTNANVLKVYDAADPLNMHLLQSVPTLGTARAITHDANTIYLADGDAGLSILEARPCWYRPCPADLNNDASLDFFDVQMYLNAYSGADGLADWNDDGQINFFDVQRYLIDFSQGCVF